MKVTASDQGKVIHAGLGGLAVGYSAEYQFLGTDPAFLQEIATAGGGRVLADAAGAFGVPLPRIEVQESLAFLLLAIAVLLLPLDVAARRLVLSRADRRAWAEALQRRGAEALQRREGRVPAAGEQPAASARAQAAPGEEDDLAARLLARRKKPD